MSWADLRGGEEKERERSHLRGTAEGKKKRGTAFFAIREKGTVSLCVWRKHLLE